MSNQTIPLHDLELPLNRDFFLRSLIRDLAGTLEQIVGHDEAAGYISLVGQHIGNWINDLYTRELGVASLNRRQVAEVLVDLKRRIQGSFSLISQDQEKIILQNTSCPFEEMVLDRPSMCMMTSNVFGVITAENLGYAKVSLEETIADRCRQCRVVIYLQPTPSAEAAEGREYYSTAQG